MLKTKQSRQQHHKNHTACTKRWTARKKSERAENLDAMINDVATAGSRRNLFMQRCHLHKVKADARRAERKMLETTSLKDIIH